MLKAEEMQAGGNGEGEEELEPVPVGNRKGAELPFAIQFDSMEGAADVVERDPRLQKALTSDVNVSFFCERNQFVFLRSFMKKRMIRPFLPLQN
jgi:hypothetical protein